MSSRNSNSLAASSRSQSQTWRWTSGVTSDVDPDEGKKGAVVGPEGSLRSLLPLLPDQKTVRQHHTHRVPVKARPQPPLILVQPSRPLASS